MEVWLFIYLNLYALWCNYLCDKCLLENTAASPTMGLFGMEIEQYVVIYTIPTVQSPVLKVRPHFQRRVMKPSTAVSSVVKAKMSKYWVTSEREFAICLVKSHCDPP